MTKNKLAFVIPLIIMLLALPVFAACGEPAPAPAPSPAPAPAPPPVEKVLKIGGSYDLTGPYAEDCKAAHQAFEDYIKYQNEEKHDLGDIKLEHLWGDTHLEAPRVLSVYEDLTAKGIITYRTEGTGTNMALKSRLLEDRLGSTTQAPSATTIYPPATIFTQYPLYTDACGAYVDWFMENWEGDEPPRFAFLTSDSSFGRSVEVPELTEYIESKGVEIVGSSYVPLVPTAPPTTQLMWLKENKVDFTFGCMINPGAQPTIKEAVRLDMGPNLGYKIRFGFAAPCTPHAFSRDMGDLGDGVIVGGAWAPWDDLGPGMTLIRELQNKYHPDKINKHDVYRHGFCEVMVQVEAIRLALQEVPYEELKRVDVLEYGFYNIKDFDLGGISNGPLTYGPGDTDGPDNVRLYEVSGGTYSAIGLYPVHHLYAH